MAFYKCSKCGAPLEVSPETLVAVCSYCGAVNWIRETKFRELLYVDAIGYDEVLKVFQKRFQEKRGFWRKTRLFDAQCYFIPFIFTDVKVSSNYYGIYEATFDVYRKETKQVYDEEEDRWIEEEEWVYDHSFKRNIEVKGSFEKTFNVNILARRSSEVRGVGKVAEHYRATTIKPVKFNSQVVNKSRTTILTAELSIEEAEKEALDKAREKMRSIIDKLMYSKASREAESIATRETWSDREVKVSKIKPIHRRITTNIGDVKVTPIILLPYWLLTYEYEGSVYKIILSGWDAKPLIVEEPVTMVARTIYSTLSGIVAGISGGLGLTYIYNYLKFKTGLGDVLIGLIMMFFGFIFSYGLIEYSLRRIKVKRSR